MNSKNLLAKRHTFRSFAQKINSINTDITYNFELKKTAPSDGDMGTFFHDEIMNSLGGCLDTVYSLLVKEILPVSKTLPLMLHNKDKIFNAIIDYLKRPHDEVKGSIRDVMKLIYQLSRDLRSDFYPYFPTIFKLMSMQFVPDSSEFVDEFFQCVCFLLNFLKKYMVDDLENVIKMFNEFFFAHERDFVRRLGARCLAFLLRQIPDKANSHRILVSEARAFLDGKDEEISKRFINSLGIVISQEIKNVGQSLRSNASKLIESLFIDNDEFMMEAFYIAQSKLAGNVKEQYAFPYLNALAEKLPKININLCCKVFYIWMKNNNENIFGDCSILINVLEIVSKTVDTDILYKYLKKLEKYPIEKSDVSEASKKTISEAVIRLISTDKICFYIEKLHENRKIISFSQEAVLNYINDNFDEFLPNIRLTLEWIHQAIQIVPRELIEKVKSHFVTQKETMIQVAYYIHDKEIYKIIKGFDLNIEERETLYQLMGTYEPELLVEQPPILIDLISKSGVTEKSIDILLNLTNISILQSPNWINEKEKFFDILFDLIDFSVDNFEIQKKGSQLLNLFMDYNKSIEYYTPKELLVQAAYTVFNSEHSLEGYKNGEGNISRLSSGIVKLAPIMPKVFNVAIGFSMQKYLYFRIKDQDLLAEIIKFKPDVYGNQMVQILEDRFPWIDCQFLAETFLQAFPKASFVNEKLISFVFKYNEEENQNPKFLEFIINAISAIKKDDKFSGKIEEALMNLLASKAQNVRKAAFNVIYQMNVQTNKKINQQKKQKIKEIFDCFFEKNLNADSVLNIPLFVKENMNERPVVVPIMINLSIGMVNEYLTLKKRNKNKYNQYSQLIMQSISEFTTDEVKPFIASFVQENPTNSQINHFHKFAKIIISRLGKHVFPFLDKIKMNLVLCLKRAVNSDNNKRLGKVFDSISSIFIYFDNQIDFANQILDYFNGIIKNNIVHGIKLIKSISESTPTSFETHQSVISELIPIIHNVSLEDTANIITIFGNVIQFTPTLYDDLINLFSEILDNTIFTKKSIYESFLVFLENMKKYFTSTGFIDLCIQFLIKYQHNESIAIVSGLKLSDKQFEVLSSTIALPLRYDFRKLLIPLISESLEEFSEPFLKLNQNDVSVKSSIYNSLNSVGKFSYIFALQSFADLQLNDFQVRSSAVGFLSRLISEEPHLVQDFILPAIEFHLRKKHPKIPPKEILYVLNSITKSLPELLPSITKIAEQSWFLTIGSSEPGVRADSIQKLGSFIDESEDWNKYDFQKIIFPLLCQLFTTPGIEVAFRSVCKYTPSESIKTLLKRLIEDIPNGTTIGLLLALCESNIFEPDEIVPQLLKSLENKKVATKIKLRLIPVILSISKTPQIVQVLISTIATKLYSKKIDKRKVAQNSLSILSECVEPSDFFIIFQAIRQNLKENGQIPILYLSLNTMVNHTKHKESFDLFIKLFAETLLKDIFGYESTIRTKKALPDAKHCLSFDTFKVLASNINFRNCSKQLVETIVEQFNNLHSMEQAQGAKKLIISICSGFVENESVDARYLAEIISMLLDSSSKKEQKKETKEENKVVYGMKYHDDIFIEKTERTDTEIASDFVKRLGSDFLVSLFGVRLLLVFFEQDLFDIDDENQVKLLEILLDKLWAFTKETPDTETLVVSLKILQYYIKLPGFLKLLPDIITFLTKSISRISNATDPYGKAVFNLLTSTLKAFPNIEFTIEFTRTLVSFCNSQLDIHESCGTIFGTLLLIMDRKQNIPEIYDTATMAFESMIRALSAPVRKYSALLCSKFLILYQLNPKKFLNHIQFVLGNLSSKKASARCTLLTFLKHFISDAPTEKFEKYSELIFTHLGLRIANETDENALKKLRKVIGLLLTKVPNDRFMSLWELMVRWSSPNSTSKQVRTGLLLLSVAVSSCSEALLNLINSLQEIVDQHIHSTDPKVKIAAIELHRNIISSYPGNENTRFIPLNDIYTFLEDKSTTKIGCEVIYWYLSSFEQFSPDEKELIECSTKILNVLISWNGTIKEACDSLHLILLRLSVENCTTFFQDNSQNFLKIENAKLALSLMRVLVATLIDRQCDSSEILRYVIIFILKVKKIKEDSKAGEKALEVVRNNVDPEMFTNEYTRIIKEENELKQKEKLEQKVEADIDPEEYQRKLEEKREKEIIEQRKKSYFLASDKKGFLTSYGPDGLPVEKVPLAPEFRD